MKKISTCLLLLTIVVGSCKKSADITTTAATNTTDGLKTATATNSNSARIVVPTHQLTASFTITNPVTPGWLLEGNILDFVNSSTNADSYLWNLDNGTYSTDRIPSNLYYVPCGAVHTITLTVKNRAGDVATCSQTFNILCRGKNTHQLDRITPPTHISGRQMSSIFKNYSNL